MRRARGFTLIELMVVVAVLGLMVFLVVQVGRSARQNADLAGGIYDLVLRTQGLKGRAVSEGVDYVLVIVDSSNHSGCAADRELCARYFILRDPRPTFDFTAFALDAPFAEADREAADTLPRGAVLGIGRSWTPPAPFAAVTAWNPAILRSCGGLRCFALRFTDKGDVLPEPPVEPLPGGFTFVVGPSVADSGGAEARAVFVSFPAGIVKTGVFGGAR